jgi:hypothetical protein
VDTLDSVSHKSQNKLRLFPETTNTVGDASFSVRYGLDFDMKHYLDEIQRAATTMLDDQCSILAEAKIIPFSTTSRNAKPAFY